MRRIKMVGLLVGLSLLGLVFALQWGQGENAAAASNANHKIIAEPGALICFAGPRVIAQTIRQKLPPGFQRAEYLLDIEMLN